MAVEPARAGILPPSPAPPKEYPRTPDSVTTEVGIFGRDGMSGISVLLGSDQSPHETYMQIDGTSGLVIKTDDFLEAAQLSASLRDVLLAVSRPLASGILAGGLAFGVRIICGQSISPLPRLFLESGILVVAFFGVLLFVAGQKSFYLDLLGELRRPSLAQ